jgi:hypothetical protein
LGYFQVLVLLADDQKTRVHTAGLTGALTAGNFGPVTLNSEQADAFSGISSALMNRITDRYRKKNLKKYVGQAEGYLPVLLEFLDLNLAGNLYQKLEVRKRRWKDFYFDLSMDPGLTTYERTKFVEDYYRHLRELSARQEQINLYSEIIRLIREGHAKLAKLIENPREPGLREELIQAGSELHGTILHFNSAGIWDN